MVSQPYVDGITDTVSHHIASPLTASQIAHPVTRWAGCSTMRPSRSGP